MTNTDNGDEVLSMIETLLQKQDEIPTDTALRLILAAIRDTNRSVRSIKIIQKEMQNRLDGIQPWVNLSKWAAAAIVLEIIGLIWAIITHKVELGW